MVVPERHPLSVIRWLRRRKSNKKTTDTPPFIENSATIPDGKAKIPLFIGIDFQYLAARFEAITFLSIKASHLANSVGIEFFG
jgi:hypothetical protein